MKNIKNFYKNPIAISLCAVILLSLFLAIGCHFKFPEYYTNYELADKIAQEVSVNDINIATKHLINPKYYLYNSIFHIWGCFLILLIFSLIFKIKEFSDFKKLNILNKKLFVYLWINLSYIVWSFCYLCAYMIDLDRFVYNAGADSFGIPFFGMICALVFSGGIYYLAINILSFITYNTKIKSRFYSLLWLLGFIFISLFFINSFYWCFSYFHLMLNFISFVYFIFIIYSIGYIKNK